MVFAGLRKTGLRQQPPQTADREVEQVPRQVQMKPRRVRPAGLPTAVIRHGDDQSASRFEDPANFVESAPRIGQVFQHVPDNDFVEPVGWIVRVRQFAAEANRRAGSAPAAAAVLILEPVNLEAAIGEFREQHSSAAADVQNARPRAKPADSIRTCRAPTTRTSDSTSGTNFAPVTP